MKKFKLDRIISIATLVASLVAIVLVLKKPAPVAQPQAPAAIAEHAQSFDQKMAEFAQATQPPTSSGSSEVAKPEATPAASASQSPKAEVHINSDEIGAVLAQSLGTCRWSGALTGLQYRQRAHRPLKISRSASTATWFTASSSPKLPGKDVWVTISGHIGEKEWLRDIRSHGIQGRRPERPGLAGESGAAEKTG